MPLTVVCTPRFLSSVCNNLRLKVQVIKVNKEKIRPLEKDTYSKMNIGKKHLSVCSFNLLCLRGILKTQWIRVCKGKKELLAFYL